MTVSSLEQLIFAGKLACLCNGLTAADIAKEFWGHVFTGFCIGTGAVIGMFGRHGAVTVGAATGALFAGLCSEKPVGTILVHSVAAGLWPGNIFLAHIVHFLFGITVISYNWLDGKSGEDANYKNALKMASASDFIKFYGKYHFAHV